MKLNRRSFFSAAAAAPIAAKQAVSSALEYEKVNSFLPVGSSIGPMDTFRSTAGRPSEYLKQELTDLVSRKANVEKGKIDVSYVQDLAAYIQIDNRRATSPAVRALLIAEERARREKARELSYLDARIAHLRDKLGIIGELF